MWSYCETPAEPADLMKKPSVRINLPKHASVDHTEQLYTRQTVIAIRKHMSAIPLTLTHTHSDTHTHTHLICLLRTPKQQQQQLRSFPFALLSCVWRLSRKKRNKKKNAGPPLCGEADAAALHADFQAIRGLAAGIHDAAVHVTRAVAVVAQVVGAAAATAGLGRARAAGGLRHHHVAERLELAKQAGQDAVDAAVWGRTNVTQQR